MHKHNRGKKFSASKLAAIIISLALVFCCAVGGTLAWLIAETEPVVNTFTVGNISIDLTETDVDGDEDVRKNSYKMIPGNDIEKDPKVTVKENSEKSWLFVQLTESENFDDFLEYTVDSSYWTALPGVENVYFREQNATGDGEEATYPVLEGNKVSVKSDVDKADMDGVTALPTLTLKAYAIQRDDNFKTAADAWTEISK